MPTTVNGHSVPNAQDLKDTNENQEWDNISAILTDCCTAINTSGQLTDGVAFAGGVTLGGDITSTTPAVDWDLKDNDSSALSFDASGKAGIINIDTTNSAEKVTMSGGLDVTGAVDITGNLNVASVLTDANVGTANTGVTAVEYGNGFNHTTVLTVSQTDALTIADNAALSDGYLLYTLPAGAIVVNSAYMTMGITAASTEAQSDTPEVGLGTLIGSGVNATLGDVGANAENILGPATADDCNGTAELLTQGKFVAIEAADAHTVYFNVADTWADDTGGDLTADIAGTVVLNWSFLA